MITETARYREIHSIYCDASPETKWWYDRGVTQDSGWDNWIIRWCLWHVFRYRDDRNRHRRSPPINTETSGWPEPPPSPSHGQHSYPQQPVYTIQYSKLLDPSQVLSMAVDPSRRHADFGLTRLAGGGTRYDPVYDRTSYETV